MPSVREIAAHIGISKSMVAKLTPIGMPTNSLKAAERWYLNREKKRAATNGSKEESGKPERGRPKAVRLPSKTGDSLLDALNNAIAVSDGAFEEYELARVGKMPTRSARMSEHSKALEARLKTEKAYREEMERRGMLVLKSEITEKYRRGMMTVLQRIDKLPNEQGPQCNEKDSIRAVRVLRRAADEIKEAVQAALAEA